MGLERYLQAKFKASGDVFLGPVAIGDARANIPFGVANNLGGFNISLFDGLAGLGYNSISQISQAVGTSANFFDGLSYTGDANRFAFYFSNYNLDDGEVTFGGVNPSRFSGAISYIPLNSKTYWQFSLNGASYGLEGSLHDSHSPLGGNAILDTGTSLIILTTKVADAINKAVGASKYDSNNGAYPIDCSAKGPNVVFTLSGVKYSIPSSAYVFENRPGECFSGFTRGAGFFVPTIFGNVFLRQYYSVYDKQNARVGLALAVHGKV